MQATFRLVVHAELKNS